MRVGSTAFCVVVGFTMAAWADGGQGGAGFGWTPGGGGAGYTGNPGDSVRADSRAGGGAGGGNGGSAFSGLPGGTGGTASDPNGHDGQSGLFGGSGGGGGYNGNGAGTAILTNTGTMIGGRGGKGGDGNPATTGAGGGGGGAGGYGAVITGSGASSNSGTITAGSGGDGGKSGSYGGPPYPDTGGGGGSGGVGVQFSATGASFTNTGTIAGGTGGTAGAAVGAGGGGVGGAGGAGLVGAALSVINNGNITGGTGGSGAVGLGGVLAPAGSGGAGVSLSGGSSLDNRAIIRGGLGGGGGGAGGSGGGAGAILSGSSLTNTGSINGGDGGSGGTLGGGAGIVGMNATVINNGTISGGLSNDGVTRANALTFLSGANTLIFGNSNPGLTGNIAIQAGTLTFDQSPDITLNNVITGAGALIKAAPNTLVLNGQSTYTGPTTVNAGKLVIGDDSHAGGSLASAVTVNGGGALGGIGTIGGLAVANGGAVAPGNSIGTLDVAGNVSFAAGSIYQVEVNAAGQSDRIVATGTASLNGGAVLALAQSGTFAPQTAYTILTANGGITGTFADVSSSLIFLAPTLSYDANDVFLTFTRSRTTFPDVAETPNQRAAASALQESSLTSPLVIAVLNQSAAGARQAFDALSGEVHASAQTAMLDDSRYLREAVLGRLRQASFTGDAGPMAALTSGGPQLAAMESMSVSSALAYAGAHKSAFPMKAPPAAPAWRPETAFRASAPGAGSAATAMPLACAAISPVSSAASIIASVPIGSRASPAATPVQPSASATGRVPLMSRPRISPVMSVRPTAHSACAAARRQASARSTPAVRSCSRISSTLHAPVTTRPPRRCSARRVMG